jgi:hypothetical protein
VPEKEPRKKQKAAPKYPKPPWALEKEDIPRMTGLIADLKTPSSWPTLRKFKHVKGFKTSETMLWAGDAGAYLVRHMDINVNYKTLFIRLLRAVQRCTPHPHANAHTHAYKRTTYDRLAFKVSTPGDRKMLLKELPVLMTQLEMSMPENFGSTVNHIFTFHTILTFLLAGPYSVSNMFKVKTHAPTHVSNRTAYVYRTSYV